MTDDSEETFESIDDLEMETKVVPACGFSYAYIWYLCEEVCYDYGPWWPFKLAAWKWMLEYHRITKETHRRVRESTEEDYIPAEEFFKSMDQMQEDHDDPS